MKKQIVIAAAILVATASYGQKDELKTLKRLYTKATLTEKDVQNFNKAATAGKAVLANATPEEQAYLNFYAAYVDLSATKVTANQNDAAYKSAIAKLKINEFNKALEAVLEAEAKSGDKTVTNELVKNVGLSNSFLNYGIELGNTQKYAQAASHLYTGYLMNPSANQEYLYYAASYAQAAKEFDAALTYFTKLNAINYTGERTLFTAKNKATGDVEKFGDKAQRDLLVKSGEYILPSEEKQPSRVAEIYRSIAAILNEQGKPKEALVAIQEARAKSPKSTDLMIAEAGVHLELGDKESYTKSISDALALEPNNVDLIYNLGVMAMEGGQIDEAKGYFNKAIGIDPNYNNAYINLAALLLQADGPIVDAMNALGTSKAEMAKYDKLKVERVALFKEVMPILEKSFELDPSNQGVYDNLYSVYGFLEMSQKRAEIKAKSGR